jgi:hypothetical protein
MWDHKSHSTLLGVLWHKSTRLQIPSPNAVMKKSPPSGASSHFLAKIKYSDSTHDGADQLVSPYKS